MDFLGLVAEVDMVVVDALVVSVLFVEFENFVVFTDGGGPVVDMVFIKDNDSVALASGDSSADTNTHKINSNYELFSYGLVGGCGCHGCG